MNFIPTMLLKQLFTRGSLQNTERGVEFVLKNRLSYTKIIAIKSIAIDGNELDPNHIALDLGDNITLQAPSINKDNSIDFPLRKAVAIICNIPELVEGKHEIEIAVETSSFGKITFKIDDAISKQQPSVVKIPRDEMDDYAEAAIKDRQAFVHKITGKKLDHVTQYSFDPHMVNGNCEHFIGVAQVPLGIAGPITINGEHAKGDFLIPMATAEGTLVASYNRGIKVLNLSGGVTCSVIGDSMQRAPVFIFENARGAREFEKWVQANFKTIAQRAEETSSIAKLQYIDSYLANKFTFLRFNYSTGDAAGQNMVGRATFAACSWILDTYKDHPIEKFFLESNFATDKKASQVNVMKTRGKRVVAECIIKKEVLEQTMRVHPRDLHYHSQVASIGSILSGANNNGLHSANGITAMFIATGQDVANVSESSAAVIYCELTPNEDLYLSITIPSLIVATYGGGVGLATQKECLEMMDCFGKGKVNKLAEIIAGVVLAGEISLASAISSSDWVSSHEKYGRNR